MTETEKRGREVDAEVAQEVMGYEVCHWPKATVAFARRDQTGFDYDAIVGRLLYPTEVPNYTTDPAADYEVLQVIRGWSRALQSAVVDQFTSEWVARGHDEWPELGYEPGDYSRAALAAIREREGGGG